jgi:ribonuclease VapC
MIVVDASALLAIHLAEPERDEFTLRVIGSSSVMSSVNYWESLVRAQALDRQDGRDKIDQLLATLQVEIVAPDASTARLAADAFARFGKRTPAGLNLGDCFAYALAKQRNAPLLYKGDDFAKTDIVAA